MVVYYNNEVYEVKNQSTILEAIEMIEPIEHKAVWLNGKHVALNKFDIVLSENDRLKVVRIRGGG